MKILHTSDWHLGHTIYGYDRKMEHESMLKQIEEIVKKEKPDVFLLCGDVFHTSQPSASVNRMFVDSITSIRKAHPDMIIIITAGNHDSGSRHEIFSKLWENFGVYTIGTLHTEDINSHIIPVNGKGYIIANPYAHKKLVPEGFIQELLDKTTLINLESLPVIMTAHTTISKCKFKGHEDGNEFSVGGIDGIDLEEMGDGFDYLALGHIHLKQTIISDKKVARYSGSPIAVSFDEDKEHSVTIIEIENHGERPVLKEVEIVNPIPLITLPSEGSMDWETARNLLEKFPDSQDCYLRLNVEVSDVLPPAANEEALNITKGKKCRFCYINSVRKKKSLNSENRFSVQEFKKEHPLDIFRQYTLDSNMEMDDELIDLFNETLSEINSESDL